MLKLYGTAKRCIGLNRSTDRAVIRARSITEESDELVSDYVLVRSRTEFDRAIARNWRSILVIGDDIFEENLVSQLNLQIICVPHSFDYLSDGDIIGIYHQTKAFRVLFRKNSHHNSFLVTENCNNRCLMCPQPPKRVSDGWIMPEIAESLPLIDKTTRCLTLTGGEPLSDWRKFVDLLECFRDTLPQTAVQVLTNGRAFSRSDVVDAWAAVAHPNVIAAIPVYAAIDCIHDYIVQAKGAFDETILGILKLKDRKQRIEIRVVLHALTAPQISETCRWIARNLPFVDHVALMGLENAGFALANEHLLWIDPIDYSDGLAEGIGLLSAARVHVSIYNLPYCVLPASAWPYAVQSISDWKNGYNERCQPCNKRQECCGMFETGRPRISRALKPVVC